MLVGDVVKYPEHYGQFESVKLRGVVLGMKDNLVLLGHETAEGWAVFCAELPADQKAAFTKGQFAIIEGKVVKKSWNAADFAEAKTGGKDPARTTDYLLSVVAGEPEK